MPYLAMTTFADVILARRGRLLMKLWEGDPTAWAILGIVIVGMIGWGIFKAKVLGGD